MNARLAVLGDVRGQRKEPPHTPGVVLGAIAAVGLAAALVGSRDHVEPLIRVRGYIDVAAEDSANTALTFSAPVSAAAYITNGTELRVIVDGMQARPLVAHIVRVSVVDQRVDAKATLDGSPTVVDASPAIAFVKTAQSTRWPSTLETTK